MAGHLLPVRVYYEDTDFSGVVYHANYLRFLERGRTELLRSAGVDQSALHAANGGLHFAVRRMTLDYRSPARMDDLVQVETALSEIRGASLRMAQRILRDGTVLLAAGIDIAVVAGGKPARLPQDLRRLLEAECA
jgi:acyl-CoA thioester hydrolase